MKFPKYMSPSSFKLFQTNKKKYFIKYMSGIKVANAQSKAMAAGSAFDVLVKNQLRDDLGLTSKRDSLEESVDPTHLAWAKLNGPNIMTQYVNSGAYKSLLAYLDKSIIEPQFEFKLTRTYGGVPILGYPDVYWVTPEGLDVIADFKVNGYCSTAKPKSTWIQAWPEPKRRKFVGKRMYKGVFVHASEYFEACNKDWANQMTMYAWMMGAGEDFVVSIEQLAFAGDLIVARHAGRVGPDYQDWLLKSLQDAWATIQSGKVCDGQEEILRNAEDPLYQILLK